MTNEMQDSVERLATGDIETSRKSAKGCLPSAMGIVNRQSDLNSGGYMEMQWADLAFHREISAVIDTLNGPQFWARLVRALERYVAFDTWAVVRFSRDGLPQVVAEAPTPDGTADLMFQDYLGALYQLDPFYINICERPETRLVTLDDVAPDSFQMTEYYQRYFRKNIVGDEVQFNCMIDSQQTLALSLGAAHRYSERDLATLACCSQWVAALMRQRVAYEATAWRDSACSRVASILVAAPSSDMDRACHWEGRASLTSREVEISTLILEGVSTRAIAEKLSISFETVRAHKKRVYAKLNINSQSELFHLFYGANRSSPMARSEQRAPAYG